MINLLPPGEKQRIVFENKKKLSIILGIVVLVFLICLALILFSIKFYILSESDYQKNILEQAKKEYQTAEFDNLISTIQKYNKTLARLDSFYQKEIYFAQALKIINDIPAPQGLYLTNFSLNRNKNGLVQANISGVSSTRDSLLSFKQSVEQNSKIQAPSFSPESWTSRTDVNFSLTFLITQNEEQP